MNKFSLSLHYLFEWFLLKLPFYKFIAVSDYTSQSLADAGIDSERINMIYNGINYAEFNPRSTPENEVFEFLYFGRLCISKGLDILLEAIKILHEKQLNFKFKLIIPTLPKSFHQTILKLLKQYNIEQKVKVQSDLEKEVLFEKIRSADAVVIPSYSEGFCFTAVETMAMGIPIISSDRGALKEVISGQFIKMKSFSAESLALAMEKGLNNEWDKTTLKKFHLEESINQYIELYKSILIKDE